jgi:hypothetical protein
MRFEKRSAGAAAIVAAVLTLAAMPAAAGQSQQQPPPATTGTTGTSTTAEEPAKAPEAEAQPMPPSRPTQWSSIGGFEVDSNDTGYGFVGPQYIRPLRQNLAFVGSANFNYLFYEFDTPEGHTNVRSPGVNVMGGLQFGEKNWLLLQAGPSFKRRQVERLDAFDNTIASDKNTDVGLNLGASVWFDPTSHNNVFGMLNYNTVDRYTWGRLAFKEQIGNRSWQGPITPYVGVEFVGQGSEDIRSQQYGGFVELTHVPSSVSVMLRAGYKRSSFDFGPDKTGPWFAIGFYHRVR